MVLALVYYDVLAFRKLWYFFTRKCGKIQAVRKEIQLYAARSFRTGLHNFHVVYKNQQIDDIK